MAETKAATKAAATTPPPADEAKFLARFERAFPKGSVVFKENDDGREMYVIRDGSVEVSKSVRGKKKILAVLKRGDFFGEMAVLNNRPRSATVTCQDDCKLLILDGKTFESFLRSDIEVSIRLVKRLAQRLQTADDLIENLLIGDEDLMVVNTLKKAMMDSSVITADGVELGFTPKEIAGRMGLDMDKIKEVFAKLKKLDLIKLRDKTIIIPSKQRLVKYHQLLEVQSEFLEKRHLNEGGE